MHRWAQELELDLTLGCSELWKNVFNFIERKFEEMFSTLSK